MKILLVDDSAVVRRRLRTALEPVYEVVEARDGMQGWLLANAPPQPDLIVADVEMPKLNGVSMAKRLLASPATQHIPLIFLTSRDREIDVQHGIKLGARHYLTKPCQAKELLARVRELLSVA